MSTPPHPPTRRRENTRAQLVAAAAEVFAQKGVAAATVDDLVAAAGYTRGAFYSNFSTKEEVFYEVFDKLSETLLTQVRGVLAEMPAVDPDVATSAGVAALADVMDVVQDALHPYDRQWYLIQTEYALMALRNDEARAGFVRHRRRFRSQLGALLGEVLHACGRRPSVPLEELAEHVAALYVNALELASLADEEAAQARDAHEAPTDAAASTPVYRALLDGLSEPVA